MFTCVTLSRHIVNKFLYVLLVLTLVVQAGGYAAAAPALQAVPPEIQKYALPGESVVAMVPVKIEGNLYNLYYFTTQNNQPQPYGSIFFDINGIRETRWNGWGIQALLVTDENNQPVVDVDVLRRLYLAEMGGYMESSLAEPPTYAPVDRQLLQDMTRVASKISSTIAFFDKKLVSLLGDSEEELYAEALRLLLITPDPHSAVIQDFTQALQQAVKDGHAWEDAIDLTIEIDRFSNDKSLRELAKEARTAFNQFKLDTSVSSHLTYKIGDSVVTYANWLDIGALVINVAYAAQLSASRADMLAEIASQARAGTIAMPHELLTAIDIVAAEAHYPLIQQLGIVWDFVKDHAAEFVVDLGMEKIKDLAVKWIWKNLGTRIVGHVVAGAFAAALIALPISDILFGRDAIYENLVLAEHSAKISQQMEETLRRLHDSHQFSPVTYDSAAELYRNMSIWYNLAAAQFYRSYANAIENARAIRGLGNLVSGGEWDRAIVAFRKWATETDDDTQKNLIQPDIIEYAIVLTLARASLGVGVSTATIFALDVSGSMNSADPTGGRKIDAAKRAMTTLLQLIRAENRALGVSNQIGLVAFSDAAIPLTQIGADLDVVAAAIKNLEPQNGTNIYDALLSANNQLAALTNVPRRIIVLLSDGVPTVSSSYPASLSVRTKPDILAMEQEVLAGPVKTAAQSSHCIYTIGFGDPSQTDQLSDGSTFPQIDVNFMTSVAKDSGCGEYLNAQDATQLVKVYVKSHHASLGQVAAEQEGVVLPNQVTTATPFAVAPNQLSLVASVTYPGSKVDLILHDANGTPVDENYPRAKVDTDEGLALITISQPMPGQWTLAVHGSDVPLGGEPYYAVVSSRSAPAAMAPTTSPGPAIVVILAAVAVGGVAIYTIARRQPATRGTRGAVVTGATATLSVTTGPLAGQSISVPVDGLVIGRGSTCNLRLPDSSVSRRHARIRYAQGAWFIQDLGSGGGTLVNGRQVPAIRLSSGDQIQIGSSLFVFQA